MPKHTSTTQEDGMIYIHDPCFPAPYVHTREISYQKKEKHVVPVVSWRVLTSDRHTSTSGKEASSTPDSPPTVGFRKVFGIPAVHDAASGCEREGARS